VFSLEPLAQVPRESEITDVRYVNLFTSLSLPCSALTEAWKPSCGDHSVWIVWGIYITKIRFGAGGKILSRNVLRRGQRVRAGSTCYICVLLVHLCVIKGQRYIFVAPRSQHSIVGLILQVRSVIILFFYVLFSKLCCFSGIVLHLLALLKASMGVVQLKLYMFRACLLPIIRRYSLYMYSNWYVLYV
jgi:hypothetical protein